MTNYITAAGVQQWTITIASGSTTGTATITAVGSGAFILYGGINPSVSANTAEDLAYLTLTDSTTITATRNTGTAGTVTITGCIVDGDTTNLIKSVQFGTVSVAGSSASGTASISAVTNGNTALHFLGTSDASTSWNAQQSEFRISLSGTTVTATRGTTSANAVTVAFVAIEFQGTALNQAVQNISASNGSSNVASWTATITSVNTSNAISILGGLTDGTSATNPATALTKGVLTNGTTFTVTSNTGNAATRTFNASIVEFAAGVLNSAAQRGTTTLTGVTSNSTTLTAVNLTYSGVSWLGNTATSTTAVLNQAEGAVKLTTTTPTTTYITNSGNFTSGGSPVAITSTGAGHNLYGAIAIFNNTQTVTSVVDNKGQTWSQVSGAGATDSTQGVATDIWYFPNTVAGVTAVTVTTSGGATYILTVHEVSGQMPASPIDTHASLSNHATNTTQVSGAITTSAAGGFILVMGDGNFFNIASVNAPYTQDSTGQASAYHVAASIVTGEQATYSVATTSTYCFSSAAFLQDTTASYAVTVTKTTATANITASWEVFEFPAFSGGGTVYLIGYIVDWFGL